MGRPYNTGHLALYSLKWFCSKSIHSHVLTSSVDVVAIKMKSRVFFIIIINLYADLNYFGFKENKCVFDLPLTNMVCIMFRASVCACVTYVTWCTVVRKS